MSKTPTPLIKDLIYFDQDKTASILSQFEGGLTKELKEEKEASSGKNRANKIDVKLFQREFGGMDNEKLVQMQTKVIHHDLLNRVENLLIDNSMLLDINEATDKGILDDLVIRKLLDNVFYIKAEGFCTINDFVRLQGIMNEFNWLTEFINKCNRNALEQTPDYLEIKNQLDKLKDDVNNTKDRELKAKKRLLLKSKENEIKSLINKLSQSVDAPDEWLLKGFSKWVDIFNPNQIHLRMKPFENYPNFEIISNLKREYFVETDTNHSAFIYGQKPDIKFTIIGLIASKPKKEDSALDILETNNDDETNQEKVRKFGNAVLNVFNTMSGVEAFGRFVTYPDITLYPLALYRQIKKIA